jgi:DNA-binding transcriptional regulator YhcF (GntR family)
MKGFIVIPYFLILEEKMTITQAYIISIIFSLKKSFGKAIISNRKIAEKIGVDRRTVQRALIILEENEHLTRAFDIDGKRVLEMNSTLIKRLEETTLREAKNTNKGKKKDTKIAWFKDYIKDAS